MTEELAIIYEGTVDSVVYQNKENGYTVFVIISESEKMEEITCVGYIQDISEGEQLKVTGNFANHPVYGSQLNIASFEKIMPTSAKGIEKYLGSGAVKGVREKLARKIVKKFGKNSLTIIEEYPERLTEISGISMEKAMSISAVIHEQAQMRRVMMFFQDFGISSAQGIKIYKKYRERSVEMVKRNPYKLAEDIIGIGFKIADSIAYRLGFEPNSPFRVQAAMKYCLSQESLNGHVYLPQSVLIAKTIELLQVPQQLIETSLVDMQMKKEIIREVVDRTSENADPAVYLNYFYHAETYTAKKLMELALNTTKMNRDISEDIFEIEQSTGIVLAQNQRQAVMEAMESGVLIITGGPGTGKTMTINTIISILHKEGCKIELAAPTGRAAKRMSEATGMEARTIHRLLEISFLQEDNRLQSYGKNEESTIEAAVVIIDESSMVDILLMMNLLKAIEAGTRIILVGDVDQLPSVGPGNVLKDIISCNCLKVVRLNEIFRQAQESAIVMNAHRINNGEYPLLNEKNKDFFFVRRNSVEDVISTLRELVTSRLPSYAKCDSTQDIQVLTPMRKSPLGVVNLNEVLQSCLNPPAVNKKEKSMRLVTFREGDKVMQIKNNYNLSWYALDKYGRRADDGLGVFNGDTGIIHSINEIDEIMTVVFDENKYVEYDFSNLDELELAYAITIHKSQGSEYKVVVIPIHSGPTMLLSRNLLYTGITRAKSLVVIVGISDTLNRMVDNNREVYRYSSLSLRISKFSAFIN